MEDHSQDQTNIERNILSRLFAAHLSRSRFEQKDRKQMKLATRTPIKTTLFSLSVIASFVFALLPAATAAPMTALAKEETPVSQIGTVQIDQEIATINSSAGADARLQPGSDSAIMESLAQGEAFAVVGRSFDEDNDAEWVSLETADGDNVWVSSASIDITTQSTTAPAVTVAPTVDILNTDDEIVYIDNIGRIKVLDVEQAGEQRVTWESPDTAFTDIALGDFNNDGDEEIVGIRGVGAAGEIVVYDPVLNSNTIAAENAGTTEIPWATLYRQTIGFTPSLIGTGELDLGIPGDEILFGYSTGSTTSEIVVIKGNSLTPDGTGWLKHIPGDARRGVVFSIPWERVSIGNLNNSGTDEVVLTNSNFAPKSNLQIFRVDNGGLDGGVFAVEINSSSRSWRGTTIGNVRDDVTPELISYRKATGVSFGASTAIISRFTGSALEEEEGDAIVYNPQPYYAFTADVNGEVDGVRDDEIFIVRSKAESAGTDIRLIALNRGTDGFDEERTEQTLDSDNRWTVGVGADVNADGRDEVVLMQPNGIRVLRYEASGDAHLKLYRTDEAVATNAGTIRAGNLDAIGFKAGASVDYEISGLENGIPAGETNTAFLIKLSTTNAVDVQYGIQPISQPGYITGFSPRSGVINPDTGASLTISVDSSGLTPGKYSFQALLTTVGADITNNPLTIPIEFEVVPALLQVKPGAVSFVYHSCTAPLTGLAPQTRSITVDGTLGVKFNAVVVDVPTALAAQKSLTGNLLNGQLDAAGMLKLRDGWGNATSIQTSSTGRLSAASIDGAAPADSDWLVITPDSGTVESAIDITIVPSALPTMTTMIEAQLIIIGDSTTGSTPDNVRFVPIRFLCASTDVFLPFLVK